MRSNGFAKLFTASLIVAAIAVAGLGTTPSHASAQGTCNGTVAMPCLTPVRADGKGMIGLGLLGGELGLFIPAIVQNAMHTNEWWPYLVFPLIGIGAGIGGGYALERATQTQPEIDIGIMVGAMVLVVPTVVGTLALATYTPPSESTTGDEDMGVDPSGSGDSVQAVHDTSTAPSTPPPSTPPPSTPPPSSTTTQGTSLLGTTPSDAVAGGPGMVRFDGNGQRIMLGVPMLSAMARFTAEELASMHVLQQQYDMQVPVVSGTF